ncbi:hypothetical protein BGZ76_001475 [Entomortierella beljakovae]|nr:hypothetical protein BGZ76_001475 [Entomortierella beljakovae]
MNEKKGLRSTNVMPNMSHGIYKPYKSNNRLFVLDFIVIINTKIQERKYMCMQNSSSKIRTASIVSETSTISSVRNSILSTLLTPPKLSLSPSSSLMADIESLGASRRKSMKWRSNSLNRTYNAHIKLLRLIWLVVLLFGEHGVYWAMINQCTWPENSAWKKHSSSLGNRYRIAVIADPQLTDWYSYKQSGLALKLTEFYTDIFMRRSFSRLHRKLQPDAVVFLGDLLDGGRETADGKVFKKNKNRFMEGVFDSARTAWNLRPLVMDELETRDPKISSSDTRNEQDKSVQNGDYLLNITGQFDQVNSVPSDPADRADIRSGGKSVRFYVSGNHDTGFGDTLVRNAVKRYKNDFGSLNYITTAGNHSLVVLDTLALSSNIHSIREESHNFLMRLGQEKPLLPRILFTHVPLFRLDTTPCGDARVSKQLILDRNGDQYQNMVNSSLTREILRTIQPDMIFSGDDHDWCEIVHSHDGNILTPEVTVPTFSFAQGSQQPAFVMLSLYNPQRLAKNTGPIMYTSTSSQLPLHPADAENTVAVMSDTSTFAYDEFLRFYEITQNPSIYSYQAQRVLGSSFPLLKSVFWRKLGKDIWDILRIVIPLYLILLAISML